MASARKKASTDGTATPKRAPRRKQAAPGSRGLAAVELALGTPPAAVEALGRDIAADGGAVLGVYRDPVGGHWPVLAGLPLEKVVPTPFQRDLSEAHVKRLTAVVDRLGRFLDPVIAVRQDDGTYWTPNGHHRTAAVRALGGRAIVALVLPDREVAYQILALNTEKAHNLREKSLEVVRMAREIAARDPRPEHEFALEFEEPPFLTLGLCYERRPRFSGGAYHPVLKRCDAFLEEQLPAALEIRAARAARLLEVDDAVGAAVQKLRERGFDSPYLRSFVVARCNPLRFQQGGAGAGGGPDVDATVAKMLDAARKFDPAKVKPEHLAQAGGPPEAAE
ncbi:MAG: chromosome partitioning protein ParB [Deltaproteobacteria bacterium]|nr:chromosome partitioning protein ParB [Deltaproteobacteria bacterium]